MRVSIGVSARATARPYTFTIRAAYMGEIYSRSITLSIVGYADAILHDDACTDADRALVMTMLAYSKEAYTVFAGEAPEAIQYLLYDPSNRAYLPSAESAPTLSEPSAPITDSRIVGFTYNLDASPDLILQLSSSFTGKVRFSYVHPVTGATVSTVVSVKASDGGRAVLADMGMAAVSETVSLTLQPTGSGSQEVGSVNLAAYATAALGERDDIYLLTRALNTFSVTARRYLADKAG